MEAHPLSAEGFFWLSFSLQGKTVDLHKEKSCPKSCHPKRGAVSMNLQIISIGIFVFSSVADEYLSFTAVSFVLVLSRQILK